MRRKTTSSWTALDWIYLLLLGVGVSAVYAGFTWHSPITDPTESNYALTAKEMLEANQWLSPIIYGNYWYDKPIFTYWMLMLSFKALGFTDFAARLPSILAMGLTAMGMVWGTFSITKQKNVAWFAGIALATTFECWYISHAIITDSYLFLWTLGTFFCTYAGLRERSKGALAWAYVFAALAVLTKGPVGIVLPGIAALLYVLGTRQWDRLSLLFHPLGLFLFLLVASPWYGYMYYVHGDQFVSSFLGLHNYTRALVSEYPNQNDTFLYFWLLPISLLPWTFLTIYGLVKAAKNQWYAYQVLWFLTVFVFYCLVSTKYLTYTYIGLIPLVLMAGQGLAILQSKQTSPLTHFFLLVVPLALLVSLLSFCLYFNWPKPLQLSGDWHWVLLTFVPLLLAGWRSRRTAWIFSMIAIAMMICFLCIQYLSPRELSWKSGKHLADLRIPSQTAVYFYNNYSTSYVYYSGHPVTYVYDKSEQLSRWKQGTMVMPMAHMDTVEDTLHQHPNAIFFVSDQQIPAFKRTRLYPHMTVLTKVHDITVYRYHAAAQ